MFKDIVESILAAGIIGTICYLACVGKLEAATVVAMGMYVIKKFMDGIENNKGEEK